MFKSYLWKGSNFQKGLITVFPNVKSPIMGAIPFKMYGDFIIQSCSEEDILVVRNPRDEVMCLEVGIHSSESFSVSSSESPGSESFGMSLSLYLSGDADTMHVPKKLSELLANMYLCGTYNFLDTCYKKSVVPDSAGWTSWGVFLTDGFIPVRIRLTNRECRVTIFELRWFRGLEEVMEYIVRQWGVQQ